MPGERFDKPYMDYPRLPILDELIHLAPIASPLIRKDQTHVVTNRRFPPRFPNRSKLLAGRGGVAQGEARMTNPVSLPATG